MLILEKRRVLHNGTKKKQKSRDASVRLGRSQIHAENLGSSGTPAWLGLRSRVARRECRRRDLNSTVPCRRDVRSSAASRFDENESEYLLQILNFEMIHS